MGLFKKTFKYGHENYRTELPWQNIANAFKQLGFKMNIYKDEASGITKTFDGNKELKVSVYSWESGDNVWFHWNQATDNINWKDLDKFMAKVEDLALKQPKPKKEVKAKPAKVEGNFCNKCGCPLLDDDVYCPNCGKKI